MHAGNRRYWLFQLSGWGIFAFINVFFAFIFEKIEWKFAFRLMIYIGLGLLLSHAMRWVIHRANIMLKTLQNQLTSFILITLVFGLLLGISETYLQEIFGLLPRAAGTNKEIALPKIILNNAFYSFVYLFIWNCIYFIYHYVEKSRRQQLDTLKLEALVKELELKTIKAHINPHFIFNSLNGIRAMVDENPDRARKAITELSNILRSSMQAEKAETVNFERELSIVRDYLALENMRFEDRLIVEYEIDEDTLERPVPPMMLQTLVENAIKHGISKRVTGGVVKIISDFRDNYHELAVQNTGNLNGALNAEGFGLSSTQNRLNLLYGEKATFQIQQINPNIVEARVLIPVEIK
ncbi:MAG TPA: histidine kinase [Chitinophagaceae bacterium]|nr:histidine kinase [Chitinophagaceae bacterium]